MRDEHEGKIRRSFVRLDILRRLDDTILQVVGENLFETLSLNGTLLFRQTVVILETELRIDRDNFVLDEDRRVNDGAIRERVLHLKTSGRQNILEQGLKIVFAKDPALFRILKDILERLKLVGKRDDLFPRFLHLGKFASDLTDQFLRFTELVFQRIVHHLALFADLLIDNAGQFIDLLKKELEPGRIFRLRLVAAPKKKPKQKGVPHKDDTDDREHGHQRSVFHGSYCSKEWLRRLGIYDTIERIIIYMLHSMSLHATIQGQLKEAMVAKDALRVSVIRNMLSAFMNELVAKKSADKELKDEDALAVIKRLTKQRKDSIAQFEQAGRNDLTANEQSELKILETYLPTMMSRDDIRVVAEKKKQELGVTDKAKIGQLTGAVMKDLKGKADGGDVKAVVESLFA